MRPAGEKGLTLVEMLVVLAIIGVVGSVAVMGIGGAGRSASAQAEAQRLAASIQAAADEALVSDRPAALVVDGGGYAFAAWHKASRTWKDHGTPELAAYHDLAEGVALTGNSSTGPLPLGEAAGSYRFTVTAAGQSWTVVFDGLNAAASPASNG